ncbi:Alpha-D-kanosaminyltransferase [Phycisphaerae bacterium RAS1]|nr:Alpha-D-kanosaminyltransferase [Phycisphaerae bacterium RAS1]
MTATIERHSAAAARRSDALHVAYVVPGWPSASYPSGIVTYFAGLLPGLKELGVRVFVLAGEVRGSSEEHVIDLGYKRPAATALGRFSEAALWRVAGPRWSHLWRQVPAIVSAVRNLDAEFGLDLLEMEESFGWVGDVAARLDLPVIARLHGPWCIVGPHDGQDMTQSANVRRVAREGRALRRVAGVSAPSRDVLARVSGQYGISLDRAEATGGAVPRPSMRWNPDAAEPDSLLFIGRFDDVKGGDVMLRAFAKLLERRPAARLTFVGPDRGVREPHGAAPAAPGPADEPIKLAAYLKWALPLPERRARVSCLGYQSADALMKLRARHAVCVVPSRYETFGNVAVEAMAMGCPLVVSNVGGLAEIVQHARNGLVFESGSPAMLVECVERLLDDRPLAARLGAQAAIDAAAQYDPLPVARRTVAFYRRVLERGGAPRGAEKAARP